MKKILQVLALVSVLIACSDFFPKKVVERDGAGRGPMVLPEKAELDEKACAYGEVDGESVRQKFVWNMATKSVCPKVREFRYYVTLLRLSAQQLCVENGGARVEKDLDHHWFGAISSFEYLIANPMEPLRAGSSRLEMEIYSWPNYNRFALNSELIKASEHDTGYEMRLAPSRKGLSAVERLIFNKEAVLSPGLTGQLRPEEAAFNALPQERRLRARCIVLRQMITDVAQHSEELYQEWAADHKQYPRQVLKRLQAGEQAMILNEISDGLFYFEKVKDLKLGLPLGQNARCREERCAEEVEHALSGASVEALRANYDAFRAAMNGGEHGPGFLALVEEVGRADLAASMRGMIEDMEPTLREVETAGPLQQQVLSMDKAQCTGTGSPSPVCRLFYQWKAFAPVYRSDFMTALNLNPPSTEADND